MGSKVKPSNLPKAIYLQIGEDYFDGDIDFRDENITWCVDKIFDNDVRYILDRRQREVKA
jgi:hypothetical protein